MLGLFRYLKGCESLIYRGASTVPTSLAGFPHPPTHANTAQRPTPLLTSYSGGSFEMMKMLSVPSLLALFLGVAQLAQVAVADFELYVDTNGLATSYPVTYSLSSLYSDSFDVAPVPMAVELATAIHVLLDPLVNNYLNPMDMEVDARGAFFSDLAVPRPAATPALPDLVTKTGLSHDCNNKLCYFYEYALSCKAIGLNMSKTCAQYFMGRMLGCSAFPDPSDFYNAPSLCLNQLLTVGAAMAAGISPTSGLVYNFMRSDFNVSCHRNCYQNFLNAGIEFYETCSNEVNATHPVSLALKNFNTFRQQACGKSCAVL
jgi:hypothetical protein